ncbi:MAG: hypothetical protein WC509_04235 [Candidatus Izemoplasmatales bacterium]
MRRLDRLFAWFTVFVWGVVLFWAVGSVWFLSLPVVGLGVFFVGGVRR